MTPITNAVIRQNDPASGCPFKTTTGYGHRIFFDWTDSSSAIGIAGYELYVKQTNASIPVVNTFVSNSQYTLVNCNSYVADINLQGWEWRVRARDCEGHLGPWSGTGVFQFAPCRLADGKPCSPSP